MNEFFLKQAAVMERLDFNNSGTDPLNIISPPEVPCFGPISITLSADRMICSSCSTTHTQFPASASFLRTSTNLPISLG